MGRAMPFSENQPFEEKVKCLADEELLEIWVESQQIEGMINAGLPPGCVIAPNFEQAIVAELSARLGKKLINPEA